MAPWTQFTSSQLPLWGGRSGGGEAEWKWHFSLLLMAGWTKFFIICRWESLLSLFSYLALRASFIKCRLCSHQSGRYISIFSVTLHTLVHYSLLIFPLCPSCLPLSNFFYPAEFIETSSFMKFYGVLPMETIFCHISRPFVSEFHVRLVAYC